MGNEVHIPQTCSVSTVVFKSRSGLQDTVGSGRYHIRVALGSLKKYD
jgi:hypothetical protein